jgi:TatD DNase family protein
VSVRVIDTHCHLHFDHYREDLPDVLERAREAGVDAIITIGTDIPSSEASVHLAQRYPGFVYAAVGIHPTDCLETTEKDIDIIQKLAVEDGVVAIGEIGLDLYWKDVPLEKQWEVFLAMKQVAEQKNLPMIIHTRDAYKEMKRFFLENPPKRSYPGVMHSFDGNWDDAAWFLKRKFYISFTGVITFKNYKKADLVRSIPQEWLLIETDAPFLTPHPYRGKRNEPAYIVHTFNKLVELLQVDPIVLSRQIRENTRNLFAIE